jgi:hypothetical protein
MGDEPLPERRTGVAPDVSAGRMDVGRSGGQAPDVRPQAGRGRSTSTRNVRVDQLDDEY